jgi:hypothetical protein
MRARPSTILLLALIATGIIAGGFYLGRGVIHESHSLAHAAQSDQTTPVTTTVHVARRSSSSAHDKRRLEILAGIAIAGFIGLIVLVSGVRAAMRHSHREHWHV